MTCIVGIAEQGKVYIGGDSAGIAGYDLTIRADSKVFTVGPYVMGFTTSFRMGQLLRYTLTPPEPKGDPERFMVTKFVPAVIECLEKGGWLATENGRVEGGTFLVGVAGELFSIDGDMQIGLSSDRYAAVGCGDNIALGSIYSTAGQNPRTRIKQALAAAAHHSAGVHAPFVIKSK